MGSRLSVLHHGLGITPDLDAHTLNPLEQTLVGGYYMGFIGYTSQAQALTANTLYSFAIPIVRAMSFDRQCFSVQTAVGGSSARVGVYDVDADFYPTTLLKDFGAATTATTGNKEVVNTLSVATPKYVALVIVSNGAISVWAMRAYSIPCNPVGLSVTGTLGDHYPCYSVAFTYAALPSTFTAGGSLTAMNVPLLPLRVASLD